MRIIVGLFRFIGRMLAYVWLWIDALRRSLVNLVFLLVLAALIGVFFIRPEVTLPDHAALLIRPKGALVEQRSLTDPLDLLRATPGSGGEVMLADLLEAIHAARDDQRIQALVIETDDLDSAGLSKLLELRSAIAMFKESGKPVIARGERFTQAQYLLASAADEVHLSPDGFLLVHGMARFVSYFKGLWISSASRCMYSASASTNPSANLSHAPECRKRTAAAPVTCWMRCGMPTAPRSVPAASWTWP